MAHIKIVRNTEGYIAGGVFHPIRAGADYSPKLAGEKVKRVVKKKRAAAGKRRNPTSYGTSYFVSRAAAIRYYRDYGDDAARVDQKIREGSIHIGKPPLKPGQRLSLTDSGRRYMITESNPTIPTGKFIPAKKIRVNKNGTIDIVR